MIPTKHFRVPMPLLPRVKAILNDYYRQNGRQAKSADNIGRNQNRPQNSLVVYVPPAVRDEVAGLIRRYHEAYEREREKAIAIVLQSLDE